MEKLKIYVGGEWIDTGNYQDVIYQFDGSVAATISIASKDHIDLAIKKAQASLEKTKNLEPYQRADILKYIYKGVEEKKEIFAQLLVKENGKTIKEARGEVQRALDVIEIAVGEVQRLEGEAYTLSFNQRTSGRYGIVRKFPIGVVAGIAPFNFPINLAMHKIAPAIASGCPIILKPASSTPLSMLEFAKIVESSSLPKGAFSVVPCSRDVGQMLVEDPRISLLTFTGSPSVGWKMKAEAGKKKVVLELGGNAGLIIDKDIKNWDYLIDRVLMGAFYQAGQSCISVQRIYIHSSVYEQFKTRFVEATKKLKVGDPMDENTYIGGLIDMKNKNRLVEWVKEAEDNGANLLSGGDGEGILLNPTILENVKNTCNIHFQEAFGPVVNLYKFENIDEAVYEINNSDFGLQVGIFSNNFENVWNVFKKCEVGGVIHNDVPSFRVDSMPYGGVKDSGLGREGVKYAMKDMMEERVLVIDETFK